MRALAEGIRQTWYQIDADSTRELSLRVRMIAEASSLRGAIERHKAATIVTLADAIGSRGVTAAAVHLAATAMISGLSSARLERARSGQSSLDDALCYVLDVLGGMTGA